MAGLLKGLKSAKDTKAKKQLIALLLAEQDLDKIGIPQEKFDSMFVSHVTTSPSTFTSLVDKYNATCILVGIQSAANKHISYARKKHPCAFIVVTHSRTCNDAAARLEAVWDGANMITELDNAELQQALDMVSQLGRGAGPFVCPYCHAKDFTQKDLWIHCPLYHINVPNDIQKQKNNCCPICMDIQSLPMMVHIHDHHAPIKEPHFRRPKLHSFALVVCRRPSDGKFLLVQEFGSEGYFLPGGAVDHKEHLTTAAIRETKEEAGIDIDLTGVLAIHYSPSMHGNYVRLSVIFVATPKNENQRPKTLPDFESAGAVWVTAEEIPSLHLRGDEPLVYINERYCKGDTVHPLSIFEF